METHDVALEYRWGVDGDIMYVISVQQPTDLTGGEDAIESRQRAITSTKALWRQWTTAKSEKEPGLVV